MISILEIIWEVHGTGHAVDFSCVWYSFGFNVYLIIFSLADSVHWLKNGVRIDVSNDGRVTKDATDNSLNIEDALPTDAGIYQCQAQNHLGISLSDKVQVLRAAVERSGQTQPRTRRPILGHSLKLNCNAPRSEPEAAIVWSYHYEYDYESSEDYVDLSDRVTTDHDGEFSNRERLSIFSLFF